MPRRACTWAFKLDFKTTIFPFTISAAASGHSAHDLYSCVDLHMTDPTVHNKGMRVEITEIMGCGKAAGQLFCDPNATLGFDRCMKPVISQVET